MHADAIIQIKKKKNLDTSNSDQKSIRKPNETKENNLSILRPHYNRAYSFVIN